MRLGAVLVTAAVLFCNVAMAQTRVGGPCRYVSFPGTATITAVLPQSDSGQGLSYPGLRILFTFVPEKSLADEPLYKPGTVHELTLAGGRAPGQRFADHYGLRPGRVLACRVRFIRHGTCTPVLFDFPDLDLTSTLDWQQP